MEHLNIFPILRQDKDRILAHYFVLGTFGNFLFGDGKLVDTEDKKNMSSHGGVKAVFNLADTVPHSMSALFDRFGCREVRGDAVKSEEYPIVQYPNEYTVSEIEYLCTENIHHFIVRQKERKVLFLDPKISLQNHRLVGRVSKIELSQSVLKHMEQIDYVASFSAFEGSSFCPMLPGLLAKKINDIKTH